MNPDKIKLDSTLPKDFDGIFRFTNFTDHEFKARWDSIEYTFPANSTSPMVIPGATPEQVQNIRKKFAKELATACFYESKKFKSMNDIAPGGVPALYTEGDIAPFVQRCLEPLPLASAKVQPIEKTGDKYMRKNSKGEPITRVLDENESLLGNSGNTVA